MSKPKQLQIDCHVHIVGDGSSGSGCELQVEGKVKKLMSRFYCKKIGLPKDALDGGNLDTLYVEHLTKLVKESSLDAVVILAQDHPYDQETGEKIEDQGLFYVPNDYVIELAKAYRFFLPAISLHPARKDAIAELERLVASGAVMNKLLPNCHNVDCSNADYQPFWRRMAEMKIPLLAHTGGEHTLPVINKNYQDPRYLTGALDAGVTVIAAHAGTKSGLFDKDYSKVIREMLRHYPNLYVDNSAFNLPFRSRYVVKCLDKKVVGRVLHGSDYPVPISSIWSLLRGFLPIETFNEARKCKNPLQKDIILKRAMGFPEDTFYRVAKLLPEGSLQNLQRIGSKF